jgi:hypothetical protein
MATKIHRARAGTDQLELIDRLVRRDRTAVSTAPLAIAGTDPVKASGLEEPCRELRQRTRLTHPQGLLTVRLLSR